MIKWILIAAGGLVGLDVWASTDATPVSRHRATHEVLCAMPLDENAQAGKAVKDHCAQPLEQVAVKPLQPRSLQACIKSGNVIDQDVRDCMKGL